MTFPLPFAVVFLSHCFSATGIESFYYTPSKIHCWSRSGDKTSHTEKQLPVFPRPKINNSYPPLLRPRPWPEWSRAVIGRSGGGRPLIGREINWFCSFWRTGIGQQRSVRVPEWSVPWSAERVADRGARAAEREVPALDTRLSELREWTSDTI